jgi:hypothetical protein
MESSEMLTNDGVPTGDDHHFLREDRGLRWRRIAGHLAEHPEDLSIALENIERWLRLGRVHAGPLHEWRRRIEVARGSAGEWEAFLAFLAEPNHDSERIKSCSPFAGLSCLTETR